MPSVFLHNLSLKSLLQKKKKQQSKKLYFINSKFALQKIPSRKR